MRRPDHERAPVNVSTIIVDDEPLARQRLRSLLQPRPEIEIVAECAGGEEAVRTIQSAAPDLLFLDIQMPELDGFDVLDALAPGGVPVVVFVTAYDQYALRAFEAGALDYLLKPFAEDRFEAALDRALARLRSGTPDQLETHIRRLLDEVRGERRYLKRIGVRSGLRTVFIRTEDLDWIEAEGNYVRLHTRERSYLHRESLARLEKVLDPTIFCRIHRGAMVNLDRISALESMFKGDSVVVLHDGTKLPAGRSYRGRLSALLDGEHADLDPR